MGKFLTTVELREPPRGGINQSKTLHRRKVRLALAYDCHGGQALPVRDNAWTARRPQGRLFAVAECRSGQLQCPQQSQLVKLRSSRLAEDS
jgi:hypothetical protein